MPCSTPRRAAVALAAALVAGGTALPAFAAGEVNVYSYRQEFLVKPLFDAFSEKTGIKVNVVYVKQGMLERVKAEGANTPADVILTADIGAISDFADAELLQPVRSKALEANIPPQYRDPDGKWFGLTTRARVIYAAKGRVKPGEIATYEDLADPRFKGRICTRSGKHVYNVELLASIIAAKGEAAAEQWARGLKANLARKPQGNDRGQAKAIMQGECDFALGNTYYMGAMMTNDKEPEQKQWAKAITLVFPNQGDRGAHVNISSGAVTKAAKNRDNAVRLLEFMSDDFAQKLYAEQNFEYPVKPSVALNPVVEAWGRFKADAAMLTEVAKHRVTATKIMDRVGFDN